MCPPYVSVAATKCYQNMLFCAQFYKLFHKVLLVYLRVVAFKSTKTEGCWDNFHQYMYYRLGKHCLIFLNNWSLTFQVPVHCVRDRSQRAC